MPRGFETAASRAPATRPGALVLAVACVLAPGVAGAMETDPYLALDVELRDSSARINHYVNDKVRHRLKRLNARGAGDGRSCPSVVRHALRGFREPLHSRVARWAHRDPGIDRYPRRATTGPRAYYRRSILGEPYYANLGVPLGRTVNMDGIHFSVDKLGHFFSFGLRYHRRYHRELHRGADRDEALRQAIRYGLRRERTIEGKLTTGVLSFADLEANFQGLLLANALCEDDAPARIVRDARGRWVLEGEIDLREYVNPDWDEAFNANFFVKRRWKHIRKRMLTHCSKLRSPEAQARFDGYARRYRPSFNAGYLEELERLGEIPSRDDFSLAAVCRDAATSEAGPSDGR